MGSSVSITTVSATISTDILFACVSGFIAIMFFVAFIVAGVFRHASPDKAFMWIKAIGAGTFFSYGQICLQVHGAELYQKRYLGVQGLFIWVQPIIFALLVVFESNYFCLFHVRRPEGGVNGRDSVRYAPLATGSNGDVEMASTHNQILAEDDTESDDSNDSDSFADFGNGSSSSSTGGGMPLPLMSAGGLGQGRGRSQLRGGLRAHDARLLEQIKLREAEEGGFPLFPTLCIAALEGFAVGFEMGDVDRGRPQFAWSFLHLVFNKGMQAIGWAALLQARMGAQREYLTVISMCVLAAATPVGILVGQVYHKISSNILRQPLVLDIIFCAASGMYMYLACFPLGEDWKQRKLTGVIAAAAVGILSNVYLDVDRVR